LVVFSGNTYVVNLKETNVILKTTVDPGSTHTAPVRDTTLPASPSATITGTSASTRFLGP